MPEEDHCERRVSIFLCPSDTAVLICRGSDVSTPLRGVVPLAMQQVGSTASLQPALNAQTVKHYTALRKAAEELGDQSIADQGWEGVRAKAIEKVDALKAQLQDGSIGPAAFDEAFNVVWPHALKHAHLEGETLRHYAERQRPASAHVSADDMELDLDAAPMPGPTRNVYSR